MRKIIGLFAMLLLSSSAFASVAIHDNAAVIPQGQQNALISNGSRWPFDLHVLTGAFPNPQALDNAVHRCVNGPNVVCIGIDPVHHKTNVHVGTATGIPASDNSISSAGNSYFKSGNFQGGIEAIATRARELYHANAVVAPRAPVVYVNNQPVPVAGYGTQPVQVHIDNPSVSNGGMSTGWWLFLIFMALGAGLVFYFVRRAIRTAKKINEDMNDFREEAFEMSSRNIEQADFHEKLRAKMNVDKPKPMMPTNVQTAQATLPAPQPQVIVQQPVVTAPSTVVVPAPTKTVVHNHYGNPGPSYVGPSTTDMLLAYELGRASNPTPVVVPSTPVVVEREVVREAAPVDSGSSSSNWDNNDSGGNSSNWNDDDNDSSSSSSSSSWDSGSSSSDSDSGSSSDWGGGSDSGSSDSGGGGSDW